MNASHGATSFTSLSKLTVVLNMLILTPQAKLSNFQQANPTALKWCLQMLLFCLSVLDGSTMPLKVDSSSTLKVVDGAIYGTLQSFRTIDRQRTLLFGDFVTLENGDNSLYVSESDSSLKWNALENLYHQPLSSYRLFNRDGEDDGSCVRWDDELFLKNKGRTAFVSDNYIKFDEESGNVTSFRIHSAGCIHFGESFYLQDVSSGASIFIDANQQGLVEMRVGFSQLKFQALTTSSAPISVNAKRVL
eukprot:Awhi_evm1s5962